MDATWKVAHNIRPIDYRGGPLTYPNHGIAILVDDNKITQIAHTFIAEDSLPSQEVGNISEASIGTLLEIIRYRWGYAPDIYSKTVEKLGSANAPSPSMASIQIIRGQASVTCPVEFPLEPVISYPRLAVWLRLYNEARNPTSDADALRNYYIIWEDMNPGVKPTANTDWWKLKLIRHFVSHGGTFDGQELKNFLAQEFNRPVLSYDPLDPLHRDYVERHREWARLLIQQEIENRL
jgi:hypothetical protein